MIDIASERRRTVVYDCRREPISAAAGASSQAKQPSQTAGQWNYPATVGDEKKGEATAPLASMESANDLSQRLATEPATVRRLHTN